MGCIAWNDDIEGHKTDGGHRHRQDQVATWVVIDLDVKQRTTSFSNHLQQKSWVTNCKEVLNSLTSIGKDFLPYRVNCCIGLILRYFQRV